MRSGWSLYKYEGQWYKQKFVEAILSDNKLAIDIAAEEGDTVTVTAVSTDGVTYKGDYRYREGSTRTAKCRLSDIGGPQATSWPGNGRRPGDRKGTGFSRQTRRTA